MKDDVFFQVFWTILLLVLWCIGFFIGLALLPLVVFTFSRNYIRKWYIAQTSSKIFDFKVKLLAIFLLVYYSLLAVIFSEGSPVVVASFSFIALWSLIFCCLFEELPFFVKTLDWLLFKSTNFSRKIHSKKITGQSLKNKIKIEPDFIRNQDTKLSPALGRSLMNGEVVKINNVKRSYHSLVLGASGAGKTSTLKVLSTHAIIHNEPMLIMDPKGSENFKDDILETISCLKGSKGLDKVKVFSLDPKANKLKYNPLRHGNTVSIVETIMSSFVFSEDYYKNEGEKFLTTCVDLLLSLDEVVTFLKLKKLLENDKEFIFLLLKKIKKVSCVELSKELDSMVNTIKVFDRKNISGIDNQVGKFTQLSFRDIFNPSDDEPQLDIFEVWRGNETLFVDLQTNVSEKAGKILGKLISCNLLSLANQIDSGKYISNGKLFHVFIDEFGSVINDRASDMFQKCRSSGISLTVFTQTLSSLKLNPADDMTAPAVLGNTKFKYIFSLSVPAEVDQIADTIGTEEVIQMSENVNIDFLGRVAKTGVGMTRRTREFRVEHDLIKKLPTGVCILFVAGDEEKDLDLVKLWNKTSGSLHYWKTDYNRLWDEYNGLSFDSLECLEMSLIT